MPKLRSDRKNYLLYVKVETSVLQHVPLSELNVVIREPIAKFLMRNLSKGVNIVIGNVIEINKNVYHVLRETLNCDAKLTYGILFRKHDLKKTGGIKNEKIEN